jgi:predicted permease
MPLAELARRIWFFLRRDRVSAELAEEMRLHQELRARREREAGVAATEATWRARRQFGNGARHVEESRDQWGMRWADELAVDLTYGLRALRRAPLPSAVVIATLAIGIGATLAMFTVMDAALFRPLPVREPERLVISPQRDVPIEGMRDRQTPFSLTALRERKDLFVDVGAFAAGGLNLTGGRDPMRVQAGLITPSALRLLGVAPVFGRLFTEEEGDPGGGDVVVISDRLWRAQFGADPAIVGRRLSLNDRSYEIVGVMPPRFAFPAGSHLWIPLTIPLTHERTQIFHFIINTTFVARLAPGMTRAQANADDLRQALARGWKPEPGVPLQDTYLPFRRFFLGDGEARLLMVMGLASLLLLAACANIGGLLLARWSSRRREIAVRAAIGASRGRLLRQLATESTVLAAAGAALGLGVAAAALRVFGALMPPELAALTPPRFDERALLATLGLAIVAAIAIGTLPALAASRGDLTRTLKSGGTLAVRRPSGWRLGSALVVVEVALAVLLLVGSGVLIESLARLHAVDTGLRAEHVVTARIALSNAKFSESADRERFRARLEQALRDDPGIEQAALVSTLPLRGDFHPAIALQLLDRPRLDEAPSAELVYASPGYFATMGIQIVAGRGFVAADTLPDGGAVISQSLARQWWPGGSPLGARITSGLGPGEHVIVGVVNDVHGTALDGEQEAQLYVPLTGLHEATIVARSTLPAREALARIRAAVQRVDPTQVVYDELTMEQVADAAIAEQRATSTLATVFGAITLLLAALGLYGLLAFGVVQRRPELGIRFALGARRAHVVGGIVGDGVRLTVVGAAIGLAAAYALTRLLQSRLTDVEPASTVVYVAVPAILLATALAAVIVPAMRAARVDPIRVLRAE